MCGARAASRRGGVAQQAKHQLALLALRFRSLSKGRQALLVVATLLFVAWTAVVWNQNGEEIFWVRDRQVVSLSEMLYYRGEATQISAEAEEILRDTPPGQLPFVDRIFIPHYHPLKDREETMVADLTRLGLSNYEFRSEWDRGQVIERREEIAQKLFTDAINMREGGTIRYGRAYRDNLLWIPKHMHWGEIDHPLNTNMRIRIANGMEHITAYEEMLARNYSALLILEDDVVFVQDFVERYTEAMLQVPPNFDVVFLGVCMGRHAPRTDDRGAHWISKRVFYARQHRCANGYVISRKAAQKLLGPEGKKRLLRMFRNSDCFLEMMMGEVIPNVYWLEPPLVYEGSKAIIPAAASTLRSSDFQKITGNKQGRG